ncbi:MAG: divergent polysaccharide deacetylase family protein [Spirochaetota bacterium]
MAKKSKIGDWRFKPRLGGLLVCCVALVLTAFGIVIALATRSPPADRRPDAGLPASDELLETARRLSTRGTKIIVIVIDDAGYSLTELEPFLALPFPLTIAVLPQLAHSSESARRILEAGKELILHQPMEAQGGQEPGPGAIFLRSSTAEATRIVEANLDSLPGALGINNHMGSSVTRDEALMTAVLELAKRRGIYYLDSLTTPGTATAFVAIRENMRLWERSVFLDNSPDRASIIRLFEEGKKKSENGSPAVMIGHIWSSDLAATLQELYPVLAEEGFSLSTISRLMIEEADARSRR